MNCVVRYVGSCYILYSVRVRVCVFLERELVGLGWVGLGENFTSIQVRDPTATMGDVLNISPLDQVLVL